MLFILALSWTLSAFVALSSALDYTCCTPDQYDMGWGGTTGYSTPATTSEVGHLYYDFINKRETVTISTFNEKTEISKYLVVKRYSGDKGKQYLVDLQKDTCVITDLKEPLFRTCVPKDATPMGEFYMGMKPYGMKVNAYKYMMKGMPYSSTVTYINKVQCVPVSNVMTGETPAFSFLKIQGFINFDLGLRNTSVFGIPEQCKKKVMTPSVSQTVLGTLLRKN